MHPIVLLTCSVLVTGGCGTVGSERKPEIAPTSPATAASPTTPAVSPHVGAAEAEVTPRSENVAAAVEYLLGCIEACPLVFIRNGSEHNGAVAAAHVRRKYEYYNKEIVSAEGFISKAATKSEVSGKPYLVKLADGQHVPLSEWLTARLAERRSAQTR